MTRVREFYLLTQAQIDSLGSSARPTIPASPKLDSEPFFASLSAGEREALGSLCSKGLRLSFATGQLLNSEGDEIEGARADALLPHPSQDPLPLQSQPASPSPSTVGALEEEEEGGSRSGDGEGSVGSGVAADVVGGDEPGPDPPAPAADPPAPPQPPPAQRSLPEQDSRYPAWKRQYPLRIRKASVRLRR